MLGWSADCFDTMHWNWVALFGSLWHYSGILGWRGEKEWDVLTPKAQKYVCGLKGRRGSDAESCSPVLPCQGRMFQMTEAMLTEPWGLRSISENCKYIHQSSVVLSTQGTINASYGTKLKLNYKTMSTGRLLVIPGGLHNL